MRLQSAAATAPMALERMKPMLRSISVTYGLVVVLLCGLVGWLAVIATGHAPSPASYREILGKTESNLLAPALAANPDASLQAYAVGVYHMAVFKRSVVGYGIYLGNGFILTASHVVGRWPIFQDPKVLIAGQELAAGVVREGTPEGLDLALLSIDPSHLPMVLRMRHLRICPRPVSFGTQVVVVGPKQISHLQILSPLLIAPEYRARYGSLISKAEGSGSGVFPAARKCLLGIVSREVSRMGIRRQGGHTIIGPAGFAGYFVPASKITTFIAATVKF